MILRIKFLSVTIGSSVLLLLMLCLGAQNLNTRHMLEIGGTKTAPLPSGFLIGVSIILGVVSGGSSAAVFIPPPR